MLLSFPVESTTRETVPTRQVAERCLCVYNLITSTYLRHYCPAKSLHHKVFGLQPSMDDKIAPNLLPRSTEHEEPQEQDGLIDAPEVFVRVFGRVDKHIKVDTKIAKPSGLWSIEVFLNLEINELWITAACYSALTEAEVGNSICVICLDSGETEDNTKAHKPKEIKIKLQCGHIHGATCLQKWLDDPGLRRTCPICRYAVTGLADKYRSLQAHQLQAESDGHARFKLVEVVTVEGGEHPHPSLLLAEAKFLWGIVRRLMLKKFSRDLPIFGELGPWLRGNGSPFDESEPTEQLREKVRVRLSSKITPPNVSHAGESASQLETQHAPSTDVPFAGEGSSEFEAQHTASTNDNVAGNDASDLTSGHEASAHHFPEGKDGDQANSTHEASTDEASVHESSDESESEDEEAALGWVREEWEDYSDD